VTKAGDEVVLLVNNLGGCNAIEMNLITRECVSTIKEDMKLVVKQVYSGCLTRHVCLHAPRAASFLALFHAGVRCMRRLLVNVFLRLCEMFVYAHMYCSFSFCILFLVGVFSCFRLGPFVTSLDMHGFSVTVLPVADRTWLDALRLTTHVAANWVRIRECI
jgi:hypothetical protein